MKQKNLTELITNAKTDANYMEVVLEMFEPLISKYSKKLYLLEADDAKQELRLAIIEAIHKISRCETDGECLKYIKNAVIFKYIHLCKKSIFVKDVETGNLEKVDYSNNSYIYDDINTLHDMIIKKKSLSSRQQIIFEYIIAGYSDSEISAKMGVSRQYINRIKKCFI